MVLATKARREILKVDADGDAQLFNIGFRSSIHVEVRPEPGLKKLVAPGSNAKCSVASVAFST